MKFRLIPAIALIATLGSCSTVYRTGQTPDDVYYSPARETDSYVNVQKDERRNGYSRADEYNAYDDYWLRMRVRNRYRWSAFDDYNWNDWRYNSWNYNYYSPYAWNSYWNSYYSWNNYYNPYCGGIIVVNPKTNPSVYTKVRNFSLSGYTNTNYGNSNATVKNRGIRLSSTQGSYNNTNSSSFGNTLRKVFSSGNNGGGRDSYYSPSSSDRPSRTYTPSNSGSSSGSSRSSSSGSSSGGSSGGGVSRPSRGN